MANVSEETQAILDRLKKEGDLVRNSGAHSLKGIKVELGKFHSVFDEMKKSLKGISKQRNGSPDVLSQLSALRVADQQAEADRAKREEQLAQEQKETNKQENIKKEKSAAKDRKLWGSWFKSSTSFFSGVMGFFKKAALFIAGGALAYEFIAGIIEEKFKIDMPTIVDMFETAGEFAKEMKNFDWESAGLAITVLGGMAVGLTAFSGVLRGATAGLAAIGALGAAIKSRMPTTNPGVPRPGVPTVNPGTIQTNPRPGPDGRDTRSRAERRREAKEIAKQIMKQGQRGTAAVADDAAAAAAQAAAGSGGGWWQKMLKGASRAKLPAAITGGLVAAEAAGLLGGPEMLAAGTDQYALLEAIEARRYKATDLLTDAGVSAGAGAVVGGGVGLTAGGVGAIPGAIAGALSGAIWGTVTSAAGGLVRAFKDRGEGIDELPNSVEQALREELAFKGKNNDPKYLELVSATRQAASDFLDKAYADVGMAEAQIEDAEAKLAAGGLAPPEINRLQKNIEELKEKKKLLDMQIQHTEETDRTRSQFFLPNGNRNVSQAEEAVLNAIRDGEGLSDDDYYKNIIAQLGIGQGQPVVMNRGGDVNNFNMTAANRSSSAIYKSNIGFGGGSGGGYRGQALPGLVS